MLDNNAFSQYNSRLSDMSQGVNYGLLLRLWRRSSQFRPVLQTLRYRPRYNCAKAARNAKSPCYAPGYFCIIRSGS